MGIFKTSGNRKMVASKSLVNLSSSMRGSKSLIPGLAFISSSRIKRKAKFTLFLGPLSEERCSHVMEELRLHLERSFHEQTPEGFIWSLVTTINSSSELFQLGERELFPLKQYSVYELRAENYSFLEQDFKLKLAVESAQHRGQPVEFLYSSERSQGTSVSAYAQTVIPVSLHPWGFKGRSARADRNFRWDRIKGLSLVEKGPELTPERVLHIELIKSSFKKDGSIGLWLGDHVGGGVVDFSPYEKSLKQLKFGIT